MYFCPLLSHLHLLLYLAHPSQTHRSVYACNVLSRPGALAAPPSLSLAVFTATAPGGPVSTLSLLPHLPAAFLPPPLVCWDHPSQVTVTSRSYSRSFFSPPAAPSGVAPLSRLIFKFIFPSPPQPLFFMPRWALSCSVRIPSSLASRCP